MKIVAPKLEATIAGTTLHLANTDDEKAGRGSHSRGVASDFQQWVMCSSCNEIFARQAFGEHTASGPCRGAEEDRTGVVIKADTVGGLEALAFELHQRNIPVRQATVGPVNKKDILMAKSAADPLQQVILAFPRRPTPATPLNNSRTMGARSNSSPGPSSTTSWMPLRNGRKPPKPPSKKSSENPSSTRGRCHLKDHTFRQRTGYRRHAGRSYPRKVSAS